MPHHLYRRSDTPNWWIDIKVKGRRRIRRSAGTPDRKIAKALAQRIEAAEWGRLIHGDSATLTFAEAVLMYVDDGHSDLYTAKLVAHFMDAKVATIKPGHIRAAAPVLYPGAKPATWNRQVVTPTRAIINHAAGKELAAFIKVKNFPELRPVRRAPAADWLPAFMTHAGPGLAALALFMRITAARIGQAVALGWDAVDLQAGTAIVPPAKGYPERMVFLTREMVAMLANLEDARVGSSRLEYRDGPVFGFVNRWAVYRPWRATCGAASIPYVGPHSAGRRAFATAMSRAGIDPKTAAELGGWKSMRLMLEIYTDSNASPAVVNEVFGKRVTIEAQPTGQDLQSKPRKTRHVK